MAQKRYKRRIKIIKPRLQLKLVGIFMGLATLTILLQAVLVAHRMTLLSTQLPAGGEYVMDALPGLLGEILLFTAGLILPLIFAVGVLVTHRVAGPVYRFEQYLTAVADGEEIGPCRIRKGDELQGLCDIINEAVTTMRESASAEREDEAAEREEPPALRRAG